MKLLQRDGLKFEQNDRAGISLYNPSPKLPPAFYLEDPEPEDSWFHEGTDRAQAPHDDLYNWPAAHLVRSERGETNEQESLRKTLLWFRDFMNLMSRRPRQASKIIATLLGVFFPGIMDMPNRADREQNISLYGFLIPARMRGLIDAIHGSREILSLEENWDGDGALRCSEATWNRAVGFLARNSSQLWESTRIIPATPYIEPVPDGSIHLDWMLEHKELLITIPASLDELISYYGDDGNGGKQVKGTMDLEDRNDWLLLWLMS